MKVSPRTPHRIGIAADHEVYDVKAHLARLLRKAGYDGIDFGDGRPTRTMIIRIMWCRELAPLLAGK